MRLEIARHLPDHPDRRVMLQEAVRLLAEVGATHDVRRAEAAL